MLNSRSSVVHWLWTHNPFYAISALLMLYAVRASYGELEIGTINCWIMMGVLAAYTSVLAGVGIMIVRWGKVWEEARSIFLLLLLMFLAVSVSADDLFVKMESSSGAVVLLACGLGFSILVFQCVLRGAGIRLGAVFQIPFILFLALFYVTPWWCSPELHPTSAQTLDWTVLLFPQIAALLCLTLLPAVRRGRDYVSNNGTPWAWPMFPWVAFGFIGGAVVLRSYALSLTFSQSGPIWIAADVRQGIVLDTIWRPYFLTPFVVAVMLLILEAALVNGNQKLVGRIMWIAPLLLLIAWPFGNSPVGNEFIGRLTQTVGSPAWLTVLVLLAFYGWTCIRKVAHAEVGVLASVGLLGFIGPQTIGVATVAVQPIPLFLVGAVLMIAGVRRQSSAILMGATAVVTCGLWFVLPQSLLASVRATICYHTVLLSCILIGVVLTDRLSQMLRQVTAFWIPLSALIVMISPLAAEVALQWRIIYLACLSLICVICAKVTQSRGYWASFLGTTSVLGYSIAATGFRQAGTIVGRNAMTAFSWSIGTLLIGALISAYKARWLPPIAYSNWLGDPQHDSSGTRTSEQGPAEDHTS